MGTLLVIKWSLLQFGVEENKKRMCVEARGR
jgi:hypothetical protein